MEKWMLIDGNSIVYRAFFAMPPLTNTEGMHTNAILGFTTMLLKLLDEEKPTHLLVAFDAGKQTFRHKQYAEYKGGRQKTPPELSEQIPALKELLRAMRIQQFETADFEADDIIGTYAALGEQAQKQVVVVSGDKDLLQLTSSKVSVAMTRKGVSEIDWYTPEAIREKYDLTPEQIVDLKGLMGDKSDNIPGVPGIGEKTALKLLHTYKTVENLLENLDDLKGKQKENLINYSEDARVSKALATISREVPITITADELAYNGYNKGELLAAFQKLGFKRLIERLELATGSSATDEGAAVSDSSGNAVQADAEELKYHVIADGGSSEALNELIGKLNKADSAGIIIESHGENPHHAEWFGCAIMVSGEIYILDPSVLADTDAEGLRHWLADESKKKIGFDMHRAELVLHWQGIAFEGAHFDVQLAAYLLNPTEASLTLSGIVDSYMLPAVPLDESVYGKGAKFKIPEPVKLYEHLARKASAVIRLLPLMEQELDKSGMRELYFDMEHPLSRVLARMEKQGITLLAEELQEQGKELDRQLQQLVSEIYQHAGTEFNLNSPKQLGEILFDKLGLPVKKKTKTGYSTDAEVLEQLAPYHEIIPLILHYRQLAKLQSTYVEGLLKEQRAETGKIHTYFRQTIAATGRLSSQFPNLQNIPIRLEEGRRIRRAFVPANKGWHILAADYSQIELRILAHISGDERLISAFTEDIDIHTKTASDVFGVPLSSVDSDMRRSAKAVNFGIIYGISDFGLSQNLGITRKEAAHFIEQYFEVFRGVRKYMDQIVLQAREAGYVSTLLGRRRYLTDINASNYNLRSFAERTALNTPIQGSQADIIKVAMVQMDKRLREEGLQSKMLLQVHDELVFEVPPEELEQMRKLVPEVMIQAFELNVPLKVDVNDGQNWYEAK